MKSKLEIFALVAGIGLMVFFFLKKAKAAVVMPTTIKPNSPNVTEKIAIAFNASLATLNADEIKRYAGWIDTLNQELANQKAKRSINATAKMVYNANGLKSLSEANLKAVIGYWQKARGLKIEQAAFYKGPVQDNTEAIPAFIRRLRDL